MVPALVHDFLLWSLLINYGVLLVWFGAFVLARDWMYRVHTRWFTLSRERLDAIHYALMGGFKLMIFVFNLAPLLALVIAVRAHG